MAQKELSQIELIEKIVRAKVMLEALPKEHKDNCVVNIDFGIAPCNCGASNYNKKVQAIIDQLSLN